MALDNRLLIGDREGQVEAVAHMLLTVQQWQQQTYGRAAIVAALVKAVTRVHELNSGYMNEAL